MRKFGIKVPAGGVANTPEEAAKRAEELKTTDLIVKSQVLAGGRGKGHFASGLKGGIHICASPEEVQRVAKRMLGQYLITKQTGGAGKPVNSVLVSRRYFIRREIYFAILLDRASGGPVMVASSEGGVNIEEIAEEHPEAIHKYAISPKALQQGSAGLCEKQLDQLAEKLGLHGKLRSDGVDIMKRLFDLFAQSDCTMVEVNPMVETSDGELMCADAKINFDDNALFRHPEVEAMRDFSQEDEREVSAARHDLNFIALDGNIGCLVNGAGLAMATMDIIKLNGGNPANFLDIGGGATQGQVTEALKILAEDPNVRAVLVNIFGGIMRCDVIALGLVNACTQLKLQVPLVVRLQGTNVNEAKEIMANSGLRLISADDLDQAAQKAVRAAHIVELAREADLSVSFELPI